LLHERVDQERRLQLLLTRLRFPPFAKSQVRQPNCDQK
jgi:hypothetical protein